MENIEVFGTQAPQYDCHSGIGVPDLDCQHRDLFLALEMCEAASGREQVQAALQSIAILTFGHFAQEERLMRLAGYSGYRWHKQQHGTARRRLSALFDAAQAGGPPEVERVLTFLRDWLPKHIHLHDALMSASIRNFQRRPRR